MADKPVIGAMSVFWGLVLFFIVLPVVVTVGCFACAGVALHQAASSAGSAADDPPAIAWTAPADDQVGGIPPAEEQSAAAPPAARASAPKDAATETGAPQKVGVPYQDSRVLVAVTGAKVAPVQIRSSSGTVFPLDKEHLQVTLKIENLSATQKLYYDGWAGEDGLATLRDTLGNVYRRIDFGYAYDVVGQSHGESIYPGDALSDVLIFERPVGAATTLILSLPQRRIDGSGDAELAFRWPFPTAPTKAETPATPQQQPNHSAAAPTGFNAFLKPERPEEPLRIWTSTAGTKIEARFVSYASGKVKLAKVDGTVITVALDKLSADDQKRIRNRAR